MKAYIDKKQVPQGDQQQNQYFIMGLDLSQVNILRTGVNLVEASLYEKSQLAPEERELYLRVLELKRIINSN